MGSFVRRVKDDSLSLPPLWANEFSVLLRFDSVTIYTSYKSACSKISARSSLTSHTNAYKETNEKHQFLKTSKILNSIN